MLFAFPPGLVPLLVVVGATLGRAPDVVGRRVHPDRLLLGPANAWHSLGPALVFAVADPARLTGTTPRSTSPRFAAQVATDFVISTIREWLALAIPPSIQLALLLRVQMVDALLTPIGVMVAFVAEDAPFRAWLALPLMALFGVFAREREENMKNALQLSTAYRGTALLLGDVLEDKDSYTAHHSHGVVSLSLAVADRLRWIPLRAAGWSSARCCTTSQDRRSPPEIITSLGRSTTRSGGDEAAHGRGPADARPRRRRARRGRPRRFVPSHEHYDGPATRRSAATASRRVTDRLVSRRLQRDDDHAQLPQRDVDGGCARRAAAQPGHAVRPRCGRRPAAGDRGRAML
jgi:hypothetical protein